MQKGRLGNQGKFNADLTTETGLKVWRNEGEEGSLVIRDTIYYVLKFTWEKMFDNLYKQQRTLDQVANSFSPWNLKFTVEDEK